jgi:hypothetical protein
MSVQAICLQRLWHTEPVEHAADAVNAEAPERTFAVLAHQLMQSTQLVRSSRVELQFAPFPACPGVRRYPEELCRLGLGPCAECTSQINQVQVQVQIRTTGLHRSIRHV